MDTADERSRYGFHLSKGKNFDSEVEPQYSSTAAFSRRYTKAIIQVLGAHMTLCDVPLPIQSQLQQSSMLQNGIESLLEDMITSVNRRGTFENEPPCPTPIFTTPHQDTYTPTIGDADSDTNVLQPPSYYTK